MAICHLFLFYFFWSRFYMCYLTCPPAYVTALRKPLNPQPLSVTRSSSACFSQYLFCMKKQKGLAVWTKIFHSAQIRRVSLLGRYWEVETLGNQVKFSFLHLPLFTPVDCFKLFLSSLPLFSPIPPPSLPQPSTL